MPVLTVVLPTGEKKEIRCRQDEKLMDLIRALPGAPDFACGGKGICGKCIVKASEGISPRNKNGMASACKALVTGDAVVVLSAGNTVSRIESEGIIPSYFLDPIGEKYGEVLDIGTTTLALKLYSLSDGKQLSAKTCINPQRIFGADVISRISAALNGSEYELQELITDAETELLYAACREAGIAESDVDIRVITGNTAMLYFYTGKNPETLAHAPFEADCLFGFSRKDVLFPPCFSAFIGADTACAILASGMTKYKETALLADLGTNGEIALWHEDRLLCCSTAAGPAFEGGSISCGSLNIEGAVDKVWPENGQLSFHTIGEGQALSFCGSGIIDAVAGMLELGVLDETGKLTGEQTGLPDSIRLTQNDIRQIQMAKSAVISGILVLLHEAGLQADKINTLYLAGGFGKHMSLDNAVRIGLIPRELQKRTKPIGNAALTGASLLLLERKQFEEVQNLRDKAVCVDLSCSSMFAGFFMENMMF